MQIKGGTMGNAVAPNVANIFMEDLERATINNVFNPFVDQLLILRFYDL